MHVHVSVLCQAGSRKAVSLYVLSHTYKTTCCWIIAVFPQFKHARHLQPLQCAVRLIRFMLRRMSGKYSPSWWSVRIFPYDEILLRNRLAIHNLCSMQCAKIGLCCLKCQAQSIQCISPVALRISDMCGIAFQLVFCSVCSLVVQCFYNSSCFCSLPIQVQSPTVKVLTRMTYNNVVVGT